MLTPETRCQWYGMNGDPVYEAYHDTEWGVPELDSRALWEKLVLDGFQAGLSWITILKKRDAFREAFAHFDPEIVARYGETERAALMANAGIIRSNAKIDAAINGARIYLDMRDKGEDFADWLWGINGPTLVNHWKAGEVPAKTEKAEEMAKALKSKGFKFVGPVIVYAFMQATGMVNDHLVNCTRHEECRRMAVK